MALPSTTYRVPLNTDAELNKRIERQTEQNIARYLPAGREVIRERLIELEQEWDIERAIEANAGSIGLLGVALAITIDRRFLLLPAVVCGFLLQHALQGWCPPVPVLRRLGFRTQTEIQRERDALRARLAAA